jgi:hypothetical protein
MDARQFLDAMAARKRAEQDQEIAAGVEWMQGSDLRAVFSFWHQLNDASDDIEIMRGFQDDEQAIIRALAMIGFQAVFERAFPEAAGDVPD